VFFLKIGFFGAGRVGCSFGRYLKENGVSLSGFFSRNVSNAEFAANFTGTLCFDGLGELAEASDVIFVTVSDNAVPLAWETLSSQNLNGKIICHCSGALASDVFSEALEKGAFPCSVHPMIAVSDRNSYESFYDAFFTVEGDSFARCEIKRILESIGNSVIVIENSRKKALYHLACVFQSNIVTAVIWQGVQLLIECGFNERDALRAAYPLVRKNIDNIFEKGFIGALTGPAERCDLRTVNKHLDCLEGENLVIYKLLSSKLADLAACKNPDVCYDDLRKILEVSI